MERTRLNTPALRSKYRKERQEKGLLRGSEPEFAEPSNTRPFWSRVAFLVLLMGAIFIGSCRMAHAYTNDQIVNAIRKAEGNWNYGVLSIKCTTAASCHQICLTTVKRNRVRFAKHGGKQEADFIAFLATRYCPIGAGNDPKGLNRNWLKNVNFFLMKGASNG